MEIGKIEIVPKYTAPANGYQTTYVDIIIYGTSREGYAETKFERSVTLDLHLSFGSLEDILKASVNEILEFTNRETK